MKVLNSAISNPLKGDLDMARKGTKTTASRERDCAVSPLSETSSVVVSSVKDVTSVSRCRLPRELAMKNGVAVHVVFFSLLCTIQSSTVAVPSQTIDRADAAALSLTFQIRAFFGGMTGGSPVIGPSVPAGAER